MSLWRGAWSTGATQGGGDGLAGGEGCKRGSYATVSVRGWCERSFVNVFFFSFKNWREVFCDMNLGVPEIPWSHLLFRLVWVSHSIQSFMSEPPNHLPIHSGFTLLAKHDSTASSIATRRALINGGYNWPLITSISRFITQLHSPKTNSKRP